VRLAHYVVKSKRSGYDMIDCAAARWHYVWLQL